MASGVVLSLRPEITLAEQVEGEPCLAGPGGRVSLGGMPPGLIAAIRALTRGGATEAELHQLAVAGDDGAALSRLCYQLERWRRQRQLCYSVVAEGRPLATLIPASPTFRLPPAEPPPEAPSADRFLLSRFAYIRREGEGLVLESPLAPGRLLLPGPAGPAWLTALDRSVTAAGLAAAGGLSAATAQALLSLLAAARLITPVTADGTAAEDADPRLMQWEFHDLLFHQKTRGRSDERTGGTFRFAGRIEPLPVVKEPTAAETILLHRPDLDELQERDLPFTRVLEERRSVRAYGEQPITERELGEFLYRVARVKQVYPPHPQLAGYQVSKRPYPTGGASYELELYVIVNRCEHLAPGVYHYDPLHHRLARVAGKTPPVEGLLRMAAASTGQPGLEPQVQLTITARVPRVSWKYQRVAYSLILKNVGVLYQTMYLVATAMGLAPCALGGGDSDLFAEAVGLDPDVEGAVGEFLLGSRPAAGGGERG